MAECQKRAAGCVYVALVSFELLGIILSLPFYGALVCRVAFGTKQNGKVSSEEMSALYGERMHAARIHTAESPGVEKGGDCRLSVGELNSTSPDASLCCGPIGTLVQ